MMGLVPGYLHFNNGKKRTYVATKDKTSAGVVYASYQFSVDHCGNMIRLLFEGPCLGKVFLDAGANPSALNWR